MKKRMITMLLAVTMCVNLLAGCGTAAVAGAGVVVQPSTQPTSVPILSTDPTEMTDLQIRNEMLDLNEVLTLLEFKRCEAIQCEGLGIIENLDKEIEKIDCQMNEIRLRRENLGAELIKRQIERTLERMRESGDIVTLEDLESPSTPPISIPSVQPPVEDEKTLEENREEIRNDMNERLMSILEDLLKVQSYPEAMLAMIRFYNSGAYKDLQEWFAKEWDRIIKERYVSPSPTPSAAPTPAQTVAPPVDEPTATTPTKPGKPTTVKPADLTPVAPVVPTSEPTVEVTPAQPVDPTPVPTLAPTTAPTSVPSQAPTSEPTSAPSNSPTAQPSASPA